MLIIIPRNDSGQYSTLEILGSAGERFEEV